MSVKNKTKQKHDNAICSIVFAISSLLFLQLYFLFIHPLFFFPPILMSIISIIFSIIAIAKKEKPIFLPIISLVLSLPSIIFLILSILLSRSHVSSRRDTQRRDDVSALATAVTQYQSNNGGKLPAVGTGDDFIAKYLEVGSMTFDDPSTDQTYKLQIVQYDSSKTDISSYIVKEDGDRTTYGHMLIILGGKCDDAENANGRIAKGTGARSFAAAVDLEGSGYYCTDN